MAVRQTGWVRPDRARSASTSLLGSAMVLATSKGVKPVKLPTRRGGLFDPVLELLRERTTSPSPARESRTNLAAALAVYKSAKTGRDVRVGQR